MSEYLRHDFVQYTGTLSATGTIVPRTTQLDRDGLQAINCSHFNSFSVQLTGTWAGTINVQFSNDATNWVSGGVLTGSSIQGISSITGNQVYFGAVVAKYMRLQCTTYTSGTMVATLCLTAAYISFTPTTAFNINPSTTIGAVTHHHLISAATTNATSVKTSAGTINAAEFSNNGAAVAYVKLYDKATAPVVGTDTPIATILVPINSTVSLNGGYCGQRVTNGIAYAITGGMAVADVTAVGAAQVSVHINYT